jgi:N-ethylmaleimide reductase
LDTIGLAYLHMIEGTTRGTREVPEGIDLQVLRKRFRGAYVANNGYSPRLAAEAVRSHQADLISFGRPFLANPDFVHRIERGLPLAEEAPKETWYGGGREGYADWPALAA